jgi:hypothetical protein
VPGISEAATGNQQTMFEQQAASPNQTRTSYSKGWCSKGTIHQQSLQSIQEFQSMSMASKCPRHQSDPQKPTATFKRRGRKMQAVKRTLEIVTVYAEIEIDSRDGRLSNRHRHSIPVNPKFANASCSIWDR